MSSPVFKAKTGHTTSKPQICGLSGREIHKGDDIFYLTCRGGEAKPQEQVVILRYEEKEWRGRTKLKPVYSGPGDLPWRSVPSGNWRTVGEGTRWEKRVPIFKWQEEKDGVWLDVETWENAVHLDEAQALGFAIRLTKTGKIARTVARKGDRTVGVAHTVGKAENPLLALAREAEGPKETRQAREQRLLKDVDPEGRRLAAVMVETFGDLEDCVPDPTVKAEPEGLDPSVERFKRLDLD